jgi:hypothetical protein
MTNDFYCDEALSGRTPVKVVRETDGVLAFHHTRPYWAVHRFRRFAFQELRYASGELVVSESGQ